MRDTSYDFWIKKLQGGDPDPVTDASGVRLLPCGFFRLRSGEPLAVWIEDGQRVALWGFAPNHKPLPHMRMASMAESGSFGIAVSENAYREAFAAGRWPDMDPVVAAQTAPRAGHNAADEADTIRDQITAAKAGANAYLTVADDETAKRAQGLRSRLLELAGSAEKHHKVEKEPHLKAGREIDAKWLPMAKEAKSAADGIRGALSKYETEKAKAEKAKPLTYADIAARQDAETGKPASIRPAYGRPGVVRSVLVATVADQDQVYRHFRDHPDLRMQLSVLAQKAVANGETVPGVTVEEERKVS